MTLDLHAIVFASDSPLPKQVERALAGLAVIETPSQARSGMTDIHALLILPEQAGKTATVLTWTDDFIRAYRSNKFPDAAQPSGASCGQPVHPPAPAGPLADFSTGDDSDSSPAERTADSVQKEVTP